MDVHEVLKDIPENHVYEGAEAEEDVVWDHEARFVRNAAGEPIPEAVPNDT